jgi:branched-chain amino acid transport system substrate-binding protein
MEGGDRKKAMLGDYEEKTEKRRDVMRQKKGLFICISTFFLFLALAVNPTQLPGAEKTVSYLSLADYTGPIAGLNVVADMGAEDYCKYVNELGGVQGVKIRFIGVDTRYDVARMVSAYKRYRRGYKTFLINTISTPGGKALSPLIKRDKYVQYTPLDGEFVAHPGRNFTWGPPYQDMFCGLIDWILNDWKAKGSPGTPTVGYMNWDSAYGREPLRGGKEYAEKNGIKLLKPEFIPPTTLDVTVQLTRLAHGGAKYIIIGGIDPNPANYLRDAHKLGLTKKIQFLTDYWGPTDFVGIKAHPEACEGAVVITYYLKGDEARAHPLAKELWTKYRKKPISEMPGDYTQGMVWVMTYKLALERALKKVSYAKLDGEAVYQAFQQLTGVERAGIVGPCKFSKTSRRNTDLVRFYRVKNRKLESISGWVKAPDGVAMHEWD